MIKRIFSKNSALKNIRSEKDLILDDVVKQTNISKSKLSRFESSKADLSKDEFNSLLNLYDLTEERLNEYIDKNTPSKVKANNEIKRVLLQMCTDFLGSKEKGFAGNPIGDLMRHEIPSKIYEYLDMTIDQDKYKITGSIGQGGFAEIPWISIFLRSMTESAQKGFYIVFLFSSDMKEVYLSFNQGYTLFSEKFKGEAKEKIKVVSDYIYNNIRLIPKNFNRNIDLKAQNNLGKGYEQGNICSIKYSCSDLEDTQLDIITDINKMLNLYDETNMLKGNRTIEEFISFIINEEELYDTDEEDSTEPYYQESIQYELANEDEISVEDEVAEEAPDSIITNKGKKTYPRNKKIAADALIDAGFKCEIDENHTTFMPKNRNVKYNQDNYMEGHHLVPMGYQENMENSLDKKANIVSLCPNCHRAIHLSDNELKEKLISKLFEQRKDRLGEVGILVSFEELKGIYEI